MAWGYWSATAVDRGRSPRRNTQCTVMPINTVPQSEPPAPTCYSPCRNSRCSSPSCQGIVEITRIKKNKDYNSSKKSSLKNKNEYFSDKTNFRWFDYVLNKFISGSNHKLSFLWRKMCLCVSIEIVGQCRNQIFTHFLDLFSVFFFNFHFSSSMSR